MPPVTTPTTSACSMGAPRLSGRRLGAALGVAECGPAAGPRVGLHEVGGPRAEVAAAPGEVDLARRADGGLVAALHHAGEAVAGAVAPARLEQRGHALEANPAAPGDV